MVQLRVLVLGAVRLAGETVWLRRRCGEVIINPCWSRRPRRGCPPRGVHSGQTGKSMPPTSRRRRRGRSPLPRGGQRGRGRVLGDRRRRRAVGEISRRDGASRVRAKMATAVGLWPSCRGRGCHWALGPRRRLRPFCPEGDLAASSLTGQPPPAATRPQQSEDHQLAVRHRRLEGVRAMTAPQITTDTHGTTTPRCTSRSSTIGLAARAARGLARARPPTRRARTGPSSSGPCGIRLAHFVYILGHWAPRMRAPGRGRPAGPSRHDDATSLPSCGGGFTPSGRRRSAATPAERARASPPPAAPARS